MTDEFRKDDVVNAHDNYYVDTPGWAWTRGLVVLDPQDEGMVRTIGTDGNEYMIHPTDLTLVERTRIKEGDRVIALTDSGFSAMEIGDKGTVTRVDDLPAHQRAYDSEQFYTVDWDKHGEHGVYSSRVDYLEPTHEVDYSREDPKVTVHMVKSKNPDAPTAAELNSGIDISDYITDVHLGPTGGGSSPRTMLRTW